MSQSLGGGGKAPGGCLHSPFMSLFIAPLVVMVVGAYLLRDARFAPAQEASVLPQPVVTVIVASGSTEPRPTSPPTASSAASRSPTKAAVPVATAAPAGNAGAGEQVCDTATVVGVVALTIRAEPTRQSGSLGEVPAGAAVQVLCGAPIAADDRTWVRVRVGSVAGYMSDRYLSLRNQQQAGDTCGQARVAGVEALSIRAAPSRQSEQLGAVAVGELVDVLCGAPISADDRVWLKVRVGRVEGYMSDRYLSLESE